MTRSLARWVFLITLSLPAFLVFAQTPAQDKPAAPAPAFEVASVKPAGPLDPQKIMSGQQKIGMEMDSARVTISSMTLNDVIMVAFKVKPYQVSGPSWLSSGLGAERFEIRAKIPEGGNKDQVREMLQALLVERFGLKFHWEKTEHNAYALVVGKTGSKMKDAPPDEVLDAQAAAAPTAGATTFNTGSGQVKIEGNPQSGMVVRGAGPGMGPMKMTMSGNSMHFENPKMSMEALATVLSRFVDRPIVDMTGLKGFYQVAFDISRDEMMSAARAMGGGMVTAERAAGGSPADAASEPSGGSIFQSVQQLGLKLEARKVPVDKVVIDQLERKPTEN